MKPDPKFGWHILWIGPLLWVGMWVNIPIQYYKERKQRKHIEKIMKDPEIAEMARLAGLPKRKNNVWD